MLGYIRPSKPQMKFCEFELYKGIYCGLCKYLGRHYGAFSRMTLSYDFTFLALLHGALGEKQLDFGTKRCMLHPLKKRPCMADCDELDFSAATAMIMIYYKFLDNIHDEVFFKRCFYKIVFPFVRSAHNKAKEKFPDVEKIMHESILQQTQLEHEQCTSVDKAAQPTAAALSGIFSLLTTDKTQKRVLERFGYLLGRFVYLSDAVDDIESDFKHNSYNPFVLASGMNAEDLEKILEQAKGSLYLTIAEICRAFDLLTLNERYRPILKNIIYFGLGDSTHYILDGKEKHK